MPASVPTTCTSCGTSISPDELMMGLAVRVDGRLLCQLCVDTQLPAEQQVVINRARALKGLPTTTYKVTLERAPELGLFTFTTAAQMSFHRRAMRGELEFATPPLPPPGASSQVGRISSAHNLRGEAHAAGREASGTGRMVAVVAVVGAVALLAGLSCLLLPGSATPTATRGSPPGPATPPLATTATAGTETPANAGAGANAAPRDATAAPAQPATRGPTRRADYPDDALAAWRACRDDRACPPEVRSEIADEVTASVTRTLDRVQAELDNSERMDALSLLANATIPSDARFSELTARREVLGARLRDAAQASASQAALSAASDDQSGTPATNAEATAHATATVDPAATTDPVATTATATAGAGADTTPPPVFGVTATPADTTLAGTIGGAAPGRDDWTFAVADLPPAPGAMLEGALLQRGTLRRTVPDVSAGTYQIWIEASPTAGTDTLTVVAGTSSTTLVGSALPANGGWIAVGPPVAFDDGPLKVSITAVGGPWRLGRVHIAGSDQPAPTSGVALASPWDAGQAMPQPQPKQQQPDHAGTATASTVATGLGVPASTTENATAGAQNPAGTKKILPWTPVFQWPATAKPVLPNADALLPSPWPSGVEPFHIAQLFGSSGVMTLKLKLSRAKIAGGGLVIALNRGRWDRKQVDATLEDGHTAVALPPCRFADNGDWQTMVLPVPDLGSLAENCWLTLADHDALSADNGFLLGAVATITGGAPTAADLGLMPAPLLAKDVIISLPWRHQLVDMLANAVGSGRKWTDPHTFDPLRLRVFSGDAADPASGAAWMKTFTVEMDKSDRSLGHKESGFIAPMTMAPGWYENVQFNGNQPAVDNGCALVAVMPGQLLAQAPSSLEAWWTDLSAKIAAGDRGDHSHRGGFLAVLVVGSALPQDDATRGAEAAMWKRLIDRAGLVGTPVIDIRPAQLLPAPKVTAAAARMVVDGLRQLAYQIDLTQKMP